MEIADFFAGAGVTMVGYIVGLITGRRSHHGRPAKEKCQCSHQSSMHDKKGCHQVVFGARCTCRRYVGPYSSYVPEVDG